MKKLNILKIPVLLLLAIIGFTYPAVSSENQPEIAQQLFVPRGIFCEYVGGRCPEDPPGN